MRIFGAPRTSGKSVVVFAMGILWVACSSSHSGSDSAGPLAECDEYAAAMDRCLLQIGGDRAATTAQIEAMKRGLAARAADPSARAALRESCVTNIQRLQRTCPASNAGAQTSSL